MAQLNMMGVNMALTRIAKEKAETGYRDGITVQETEALGAAIAAHFEWTGEEIVATFLAALEDANFHTFRAVVEDAWKAESARA